jgi:uncharacterized protein (DUF1499 family)
MKAGKAATTIPRLALAFAAAQVFVLALGAVAAHFGLSNPLTGFRLALLGIPLALVALVLGLTGLVVARRADGVHKKRALLAIAAGGGFILLVFLRVWSARAYPAINDITTDWEDIPAIRIANQPAAPPHPKTIATQRTFYPEIAPAKLAAAPEDALRRAESAAKRLGWTIVSVDAGSLGLQAQDTSSVFRFVDDIAVRVRKLDSGSVVDVRSRSRDGKGDLGVNARRIRAFVEELEKSGG